MSRVADRPRSEQPAQSSDAGVVAAVDPGSPAARAGITAGSSIISVDGHRLRDVIDWRWHADGLAATIEWSDQSGVARVSILERAAAEPWGIDFAEQAFDGVRTCRNRCAFCFMAQLPRGLRPALYVRDDDYRLSFLQGNFLTLTNVTDADVERILEQRLSPLYVSVHASDPVVRQELICASEDRALEVLDRLVEGGILVHAQIVLVPGVNDGTVLERTLEWLAAREGVASVGVVPLGFTRFQTRFERSYEARESAGSVLAQLDRWREEARRQRAGVSWVYAADEFYLNAGLPIPPAEEYDGFPQYENGIGLVRTLLDDAESDREALLEALQSLARGERRVTVVSGTMAAPVIGEVVARVEESHHSRDTAPVVRVLPVTNRFFGGNVAVTGLLTGRDIIEALRVPGDDDGKREAETCLLPDIVFNADGLTLDDLTLEDIRQGSGRDVRLVSSDASGLLEGILSAASSPT